MMVVRRIWWDGDQIRTQEVPLAEVYVQEKDMEIKTEIKPDADGTVVITEKHTLMDIARWLITLTDASEMKYCLDKAEAEKDSMETMDFGDALAALKAGSRVAREGWNGKGMWIGLHTEIGMFVREACGTELTYRDYITMKTVDNHLVPWVASQTDLLAEDWVLVN